MDLVEYCTLGGCIFGLITTAITKQILYTLAPLTCTLFLNSINLQKYKKQLLNSNDLIQSLIAFDEEYKYRRIELEALTEEVTNKISEFKNIANDSYKASNLQSIQSELNDVKLSNSDIEKNLTQVY